MIRIIIAFWGSTLGSAHLGTLPYPGKCDVYNTTSPPNNQMYERMIHHVHEATAHVGISEIQKRLMLQILMFSGSEVAQACVDLVTCQNLMCRGCLLMSVSEGMKNPIFQVCVRWRHFSKTFRRANDDNLDNSHKMMVVIVVAVVVVTATLATEDILQDQLS